VYDVWTYDVWCMMYDVWRMMYDVRCMMYDVWCMMTLYDVWCVMYTVLYLCRCKCLDLRKSCHTTTTRTARVGRKICISAQSVSGNAYVCLCVCVCLCACVCVCVCVVCSCVYLHTSFIINLCDVWWDNHAIFCEPRMSALYLCILTTNSTCVLWTVFSFIIHSSCNIHHTSYIIHHKFTSYITHHTHLYIIHHTTYIIHHTSHRFDPYCYEPLNHYQYKGCRGLVVWFLQAFIGSLFIALLSQFCEYVPRDHYAYSMQIISGDAWCMMYGVWCVLYDVWCMMCDVWCMMVWCMMYDVWCMI